ATSRCSKAAAANEAAVAEKESAVDRQHDLCEPACEAGAPNRREFLQHSAVATAGTVLTGGVVLQAGQQGQLVPLTNTEPGCIPRKRCGRHDEQVSIIGLGGFSLGSVPTYEEAERIVRESIDAGLTFFDNAWEYHDGRSEEWMGRALRGRRDRVFLMTKV